MSNYSSYKVLNNCWGCRNDTIEGYYKVQKNCYGCENTSIEGFKKQIKEKYVSSKDLLYLQNKRPESKYTIKSPPLSTIVFQID